jgi:hypothetical protein
MDESIEQEEEIIIENIEDPDVQDAKTNDSKVDDVIVPEEKIPEIVPSIKNIDEEEVVTRLTFDNTDRKFLQHAKSI